METLLLAEQGPVKPLALPGRDVGQSMQVLMSVQLMVTQVRAQNQASVDEKRSDVGDRIVKRCTLEQLC